MVAFGFLNINKPRGMTSHDSVAQARRSLGIKKVGHAGTLDPLATGVLILCLGGATRLSAYVMDTNKCYRATVRLGIETDTYDAEGTVLRECDASGITQADVERLLPSFEGEIEQLPPMYSAIKRQGRKLYELARAGQTVEREPRKVSILRLHLADWSPPLMTLEVTCSAGTYIRSLAHDLGEALGVGASLAALERTASGGFSIEDSVTPDVLFSDPDWRKYVIPARRALAAYYSLTLTGNAVNDIYNGRPISKPENVTNGMLAMGYDLGGQLRAGA